MGDFTADLPPQTFRRGGADGATTVSHGPIAHSAPAARASSSASIYPIASSDLPGSSPTRQSAGIRNRVAGIVSRLAAPGAAGSARVRRSRSPPPPMPGQPRRSQPDPQRPGPSPPRTLPTTAPTADPGWLQRRQPRAVHGAASSPRHGVPGPAAVIVSAAANSSLSRAASCSEGGPPSPDSRRASARLPYLTAARDNRARARACAFRSSGMLAVLIAFRSGDIFVSPSH